MENAVLRTLIYADIFSHPLKAWEIHKWLIKKKCNLREVERCLQRMKKKKGIKEFRGYFFIGKNTAKKREQNISILEKHKRRGYLYSLILKTIPFIKMVGVSGGLAVENVSELSDIDFFIVTSNKRLWITRLLVLSIIGFIGGLRRRGDSDEESRNKICINSFIEIDSLAFNKRDIYIAHEILQLKLMWQRDDTYQKFLESNLWAMDYLPNWSSGIRGMSKEKKKVAEKGGLKMLDHLNSFAKFLQIRYMGKILGKERIGESYAFFYPDDYKDKVLDEYKKRVNKLLA